jgi:hypothetical protein
LIDGCQYGRIFAGIYAGNALVIVDPFIGIHAVFVLYSGQCTRIREFSEV